MTFDTLAAEAPKKGVQLVGSGDCLHETWLKEIKALNQIEEGTFELGDTKFILTVEVQGKSRVHHLIMFPSISSAEDFKDGIKAKTKNISSDGRPMAAMTGEEIGQLAVDVDAIFGPCHAFTPWTGLYGHFDSLQDCYGDLYNKISFLELGLSADTDYADRLDELRDITFLSNSDAHSPYPLRLAREFNQFKVDEVTFPEIKKAILRQGGRKCTLNVGFPPEEGKYNQTACSRCFNKYSLSDSLKSKWKCSCGGRIKKGVFDRVSELGGGQVPKHPKHRPKYLHIIPLAEIIAKAIKHSNTNSAGVKKIWSSLIDEFENEINVLLKIEIEKIISLANTNTRIATAIRQFRDNKIILHPGGGGRYGQIELPKLNLFDYGL
jgi:uncharacterized protein (TIGR00375 family)